MLLTISVSSRKSSKESSIVMIQYRYFPAGNSENFKLEIMIRQMINYESPEIVEYVETK